MAIANTFGAAWAICRFANAGPQWIEIVPPNDQPPHEQQSRDLQYLSALPIKSLRLSPATCLTLQRLGVTTVGRLQQLPRPELLSRFGDEIQIRLDQATGALDEIIPALVRPAEFSASQTFEFPTHHRETLEVVARRLINHICNDLQRHQLGSLQWTITLTASQRQPDLQFDLSLCQPTTDPFHIAPLLQMQLDHLPPPQRGQRRS